MWCNCRRVKWLTCNRTLSIILQESGVVLIYLPCPEKKSNVCNIQRQKVICLPHPEENNSVSDLTTPPTTVLFPMEVRELKLFYQRVREEGSPEVPISTEVDMNRICPWTTKLRIVLFHFVTESIVVCFCVHFVFFYCSYLHYLMTFVLHSRKAWTSDSPESLCTKEPLQYFAEKLKESRDIIIREMRSTLDRLE